MAPTGDARTLAEGFVADHFPDAVGVVLAGSGATGTDTPTSDLDLVLLLPASAFADGRTSLAATYAHHGRLVEVFAYTPQSYRVWAEQEAAAHRPVVLAMLAEGVVLRDGPVVAGLREWARDVLASGPVVGTAALDLRRYRVSGLLDDLADAADPGERAVLLAGAYTALAELLLLAHGRWLGHGKWLLRHLRAWDVRAADALTDAFVAADVAAFVRVADDRLAPLGGRLQAGMVR
ncbi:nucleotidyltransferase domain-containing protein [Cellulomonas sp. Sa3CUA2]|uniref:Nucleotidyltransferase domain-containing protein n=1 Tax=Cellulomonas avistercoris TaxID=2762242 RepID=A0ABR8QFU5_9CELL|nr:nucleotidyltransferase domain-containing protein [Cellulomonas avistercoris]MBD7919298.1 nucleotidyltransferase domain-containing protein [Cellulomonas avistercoris]